MASRQDYRWTAYYKPSETHYGFSTIVRAPRIGSGVWGVYDSGVMGWRGTHLAENEAKQRAADLNVMFDQYGNRDPKERRKIQAPIPSSPPPGRPPAN